MFSGFKPGGDLRWRRDYPTSASQDLPLLAPELPLSDGPDARIGGFETLTYYSTFYMPLTSELIFAHGLHLYQLKFLMKFNAQKSQTLLFWFKHTATSIGLGAARTVGDGPAAA